MYHDGALRVGGGGAFVCPGGDFGDAARYAPGDGCAAISNDATNCTGGDFGDAATYTPGDGCAAISNDATNTGDGEATRYALDDGCAAGLGGGGLGAGNDDNADATDGGVAGGGGTGCAAHRGGGVSGGGGTGRRALWCGGVFAIATFNARGPNSGASRPSVSAMSCEAAAREDIVINAAHVLPSANLPFLAMYVCTTPNPRFDRNASACAREISKCRLPMYTFV